MNIGFTGHRNKNAPLDSLRAIAREFDGAVWVHGGATGFDQQVESFAKNAGIQTLVIVPARAQRRMSWGGQAC